MINGTDHSAPFFCISLLEYWSLDLDLDFFSGLLPALCPFGGYCHGIGSLLRPFFTLTMPLLFTEIFLEFTLYVSFVFAFAPRLNLTALFFVSDAGTVIVDVGTDIFWVPLTILKVFVSFPLYIPENVT